MVKFVKYSKKQITIPPTVVHDCPECGAVFAHASGLSRHKKTHGDYLMVPRGGHNKGMKKKKKAKPKKKRSVGQPKLPPITKNCKHKSSRCSCYHAV